MKRTLKNILSIVLLVLCLCTMLLTMVQNHKGTNIVDWTIQQAEHFMPQRKHESSSSKEDASTTQDKEPAQEAENSSADQPDSTIPPVTDELPDPTPEHPRTEAREVQIFHEEIPQTDPDHPKTHELVQKSWKESLTLYEKDKDGQYQVLGLNWKSVAAFGVESLIFCMVFWELLMSGFHKKTLKETFKNFDKFLIWMLVTLLSAAAMTVGDIWITRKYFSDSKADLSIGKLETPSEKPDENPADENKPPQKPDEKPDHPEDMTEEESSWKAVLKIDSDTALDHGEYSSNQANENAILVEDASATLSQGTVEKTGSSSQKDATSFYGINSAILAVQGADVSLSEMSIETDADGANGVFSYGSKDNTPTKVVISSSSITTNKDQSGGIMTAGGAQLQASDLKVNTYGQSSAAIRSDRGGGYMSISKGSYTTYGNGSPAIYSTADIQVQEASLTSNASEGIVVEGHNSVLLQGCILKDTNTTLHGLSETYKNIFLYQSMSGDAKEGLARFQAENSEISTGNGDTFYVTNTEAQIDLSQNVIENLDPLGSFLRIEAGPWGNEGKNGGLVSLNASAQSMKGDIHVDSHSELYVTMKDKSSFTGAINPEKSGRKVTLSLTKDCKIKLTGDSYVDKLTNEDKKWSNIDYNGYTLYVNGKGWNASNS